MSTPLAGGTAGPDALRPLLAVVLDALRDGAADRGGPLPAGGPDAVAARMREAAEPLLPERRALLATGRAGGRLWLKATLLNPYATSGDLAALIQEVLNELVLVEGSTPR